MVTNSDTIIYAIFIIFTGASILSTFFILARQSLIVCYIFLGMILGPYGVKLTSNIEVFKQMSEIGVIFLLFIMGINLRPKVLIKMISKIAYISILSSIIFFLVGYVLCMSFKIGHIQSIIVSSALIFSSTIIGLKLLPTKLLQNRHKGEMLASILLFQDFFAICIILVINTIVGKEHLALNFFYLTIGLPVMLSFCYLVEKFILRKLFVRYRKIHEYVFLLTIGWCFGVAEIGKFFNLSPAIGAFIAGVVLANTKVDIYKEEGLRSLRDFFLIMFFFSIGASFDFYYFPEIIVPAVVFSIILIIVKPLVFYFLFQTTGENKQLSKEIGLRLGQSSEFSFLIMVAAAQGHLLQHKPAHLLQAVTITTFVLSSIIIVLKYPTPLSVDLEHEKTEN